MIPSPFQALRISHRDVSGTRVTGDEAQWTMGMRKKRDVWLRVLRGVSFNFMSLLFHMGLLANIIVSSVSLSQFTLEMVKKRS